jgi:RNA 3'-terminal phosphate cyclase-like protein
MLILQGSALFRQRIICSTLTSRPIRIKDIRSRDQNPGLRDYEVSFLRLIEKVTNGCVIEINETGTQIVYKPGVISGSNEVVHDCGVVRGVGYFLEGLICLLPFGKNASEITLLGVTNEHNDISVDLLRTTTLASLQRFGMSEGLELKVAQRGAIPLGGGKVIFKCPIVKTLTPIKFVDEGVINRVRGIAYSTRVSPQIGHRIVESARSILNDFLPNIFIYTDHYRGSESGQ